MGFENNFNGIYFHHHFYVKTGVRSMYKFLLYYLAPETYSDHRPKSSLRVMFLKFMFSKKATKIDEIKCQIDGEDFVNFCSL